LGAGIPFAFDAAVTLPVAIFVDFESKFDFTALDFGPGMEPSFRVNSVG
jgi:hypothetical protein